MLIHHQSSNSRVFRLSSSLAAGCLMAVLAMVAVVIG